MFVFAKLAVVTCMVYLGFAILLDAAVIGLVWWKGGVFVSFSKSWWLAIFSVIWLLSFLLAWRIVIVSMLARMPRR